MDRRNFVAASTALGIGIISCVPVAAMTEKKDLLSAPHSCVGDSYLLKDGTELLVQTVERVGDAYDFKQWHVQFESSAALTEGIYELRSANATHTSLFLQCTNNIATASITRRR